MKWAVCCNGEIGEILFSVKKTNIFSPISQYPFDSFEEAKMFKDYMGRKYVGDYFVKDDFEKNI